MTGMATHHAAAPVMNAVLCTQVPRLLFLLAKVIRVDLYIAYFVTKLNRAGNVLQSTGS